MKITTLFFSLALLTQTSLAQSNPEKIILSCKAVGKNIKATVLKYSRGDTKILFKVPGKTDALLKLKGSFKQGSFDYYVFNTHPDGVVMENPFAVFTGHSTGDKEYSAVMSSAHSRLEYHCRAF